MEEQRKPGRYRRKRYKSLTPVLIAALLLLIAIIVAVVVLVPPLIRQLREPTPDLPATPPASVEQATDPKPATPAPAPETPPAEAPEDVPQEPEAPALPAASFDPRFVMNTDALTESEADGVTTYLDAAAPGARMDVQKLSMSAELLLDEELERIAIAILQAYYYNPPKTEDVSVQIFHREEDVCSIVLSAPAVADAPAALVHVKMLNIDSDMWFAALLLPDGASSDALLAAFGSLTHEDTP